MKTGKKSSIIFSFLCTVFLAMALCLAPMGKNTASAEETEKLITDFTKGTDGWSCNDFAIADRDGLTLISGATATTEGEHKSFIAFFAVDSLAGSLTISFSENCSLTLSGNKIIATGLQTANKQTTVVLKEGLGDVELMKLEIMSDYAELSVKRHNEPYDYLGTPVATFYTQAPLQAKPIRLSVTKGICILQNAKIYTLQGSIYIETENYVAPVIPDEEEESQPEKKGCKSSVSVFPLIAVLFGGLIVAVKTHGKREE